MMNMMNGLAITDIVEVSEFPCLANQLVRVTVLSLVTLIIEKDFIFRFRRKV